MMMELYVKGKFTDGFAASAYVVVENGKVVAEGSSALGDTFIVGGIRFPYDQFNGEVLAAICGLARCGEGKEVTVFSNNKSVVKWLSRGEEPLERSILLNIFRLYARKRTVSAEYIPFWEKDQSGNEWNKRCNSLAEEALGLNNKKEQGYGED